MSPGLETLLAEQVRAYRGQLRGGGVLLIVIAVLGGLALWWLEGHGGLSPNGARGIAMSFLAVPLGILLFVMGLRDPKKHRSVDGMRAVPGEIVWTYVVRPPIPKPKWLAELLRSRPFGKLFVGFQNGALVEVPIDYGKEDAVAAAVKAEYPRASHGWTAQRASTFRAAPASLRVP